MTIGIGILAPLVLFFGITVIYGLSISGTAIKNIEHRRRPD
jgi:hypothetical protein